MEHRGVEADREPPEWFRNHVRMYHWPHVQYLLVRRPAYQTGVSLRAGFAVQCLQTFALSGEPPLVKPGGAGLGAQSVFELDGIDLSRDDVSKGPHGPEVLLAQGEPRADWDGLGAVTLAPVIAPPGPYTPSRHVRPCW